MAELKKTFPQGVDYSIIYDPTVFVRESIHAVIETLLEALLLVVIVVVLFLQTWRAALIPVIAVPVAIIGSFAALSAFGFAINTLTPRSEERRVGKEGGSTCSSRWSPDH